ncbi:peptidoglycan-associated lipoprotein Pal [Candidatus Nitronereus thalassa]|uniref:Peptidoglycan-associated protein n=1 Tax=Candidatus Nitronereus thalassa TaxID=3020898 RepID=A0ABU3KAN2_9BACT|nr:peptidoglycan-associated lipoprotein Pal [Candidatus Nitronereus thalassa]MDT7043447.1 peptidoglycan-associated lipoprotein Pal [Candidatus Nitronereus thalassa]
MQREFPENGVCHSGVQNGGRGIVVGNWCLPLLFLFGLLTGCETTGQVRSITDEDIPATRIIPPVVKEEPVLENVVDEPKDLPTLAESVTPSETIQQELIEAASPEQLPEAMETAPVKPLSPPKDLPLATPHTPESLESTVAPPSEPIQPKTLQDVYFDFDQATILSSAKIVLQTNARLLQTHFQHLNILIEGHCDERGSVEYNLVLGVRRAQAVQTYLRDLGIPQSRIRIVSYGKERPVCSEQHERCWQKNRRAHFVLR